MIDAGIAVGAAAFVFMVIAVIRRPPPDKPPTRSGELCPYCHHDPRHGPCREVVDAAGWGRDTVCGCTWNTGTD